MPQQVERRRLVVFTRFPEAGRSKTRLIPALGASGAAALHRALVEHCLRRVSPLQQSGTELELRAAGGDEGDWQQWLGDWLTAGAHLVAQRGGDLGQRMHDAFVDAAADAIEATLLFGTDIPALDATVLERAFGALESGADAVFGPALDGGYYLVGLRKPQPELFFDQHWSTPTVLAETLERTQQIGLQVALVDQLGDIDTPADLERLRPFANLSHFIPG